jgi:hypothetical protein
MPDSEEHDGAFLYPRTFALAKVNRFKEAHKTLEKLNTLKNNHQYSRFLAKELLNENENRSILKDPGNRDKQVICIVSGSYSGSTLLSAILGSHSSIIAAGEVRWLIEKNTFDIKELIEKTKKLTKRNSVPWNDETFESATYSNIYNKIFDAFDSNFIVDSSKEPIHFENILNNTPTNSYDLLFVTLWKHPVRSLSSHLMHRWNKWEQLKNYDRNDSIIYLINDIYNKFNSINNLIQKIGNNYRYVNIKYEDIVEDTKSSILCILDEINLEYESGMENYQNKEQYILGGNFGALSQVAKTLNNIDSKFDIAIRDNFYKNIKGIEMDNNYKNVFSQDEIKSIYKNDKIKILLDSLGYKPIY